MQNKLVKILLSKKFLIIYSYIIPLLFLLIQFNTNYYKNGLLQDFFFKEFLIYLLIIYILNTILIFIENKLIKDMRIVLLLKCFESYFFLNYYSGLEFLISYIIVLVITLLLFKKTLLANTLNEVTAFLIFTFSIMLIFNVFNFGINGYHTLTKTKSYNQKVSFKVDDNTPNPNIYWIHCDEMLSFAAMKKYYNYESKTLATYLEDNNYLVNDDAKLIAGHHTRLALPAMFSPKYYDSFYKEYLIQLEKSLFENKNTYFILDYYNLENERLDNELLQALKIKNYKTISITEFNQHSSLFTDEIYDFNEFKNDLNPSLKYLTLNKNSKSLLKKYIHYIHFIDKQGVLFNFILNQYFYNYKNVEYEKEDYKEYPNINNSKYLLAKAILKSLELSKSESENTFTFLNFRLNHFPILFDKNGNLIDNKNHYNTQYYDDNYQYSELILVDILKFIKNIDENAIIILQSDHGIHMIRDNFLIKELNITNKDLPGIKNSVMSAIYIPEQFKNGDEKYLNNPLNIGRYLVNNFVGNGNYKYIE